MKKFLLSVSVGFFLSSCCTVSWDQVADCWFYCGKREGVAEVGCEYGVPCCRCENGDQIDIANIDPLP